MIKQPYWDAKKRQKERFGAKNRGHPQFLEEDSELGYIMETDIEVVIGKDFMKLYIDGELVREGENLWGDEHPFLVCLSLVKNFPKATWKFSHKELRRENK